MNTILVVAPHPDDETIGCGGTLLKHKANGDVLHWLIFTDMSVSADYTDQEKETRAETVADVTQCYEFSTVVQLKFEPAALDQVPKKILVKQVGEAMHDIQPDIVYLPYRSDVHSDHEAVFDVCIAATKQFRLPCVKEILAYETLSETEFCLKPDTLFRPNYFINIELFLEGKKGILSRYKTELADFPFPRSIEAVDALAKYRGVQANVQASEAFMLLKKIC